MSRSSVRPPHDTALPGSELLFDIDALRTVVGAPEGAELRLRYVEHVPGDFAVVVVAVDRHPVAVSVGRIAPVDAGLQVAWYPDDPALPGLRDGWAGLLPALGLPLDEPERLTWVPHRRLVVAAGGDVIVKLHERGDETEQAVACAELVRSVVAVPDVLVVDVERASHVQRRVAGRALGRDDAGPTVDAACDVLRRLRGLDPSGMVRHAPADLLAHGRQVARLAGFLVPALDPRLAQMLDRLDETQPAVGELVAAHGDFNVGQLLLGDDGLVLVDTDTLCAASAAYDPASYAANLVAGRPGDLDEARRVLHRFGEQVGEAHGRPLDGQVLEWYFAAMVVRRLDRGLRRYKRDWHGRTERLVDAAGQLVAAL